MTTRLQDFLFKWSVAVVVFAGVEVGTVVRPAVAAVSGAWTAFVG